MKHNPHHGRSSASPGAADPLPPAPQTDGPREEATSDLNLQQATSVEDYVADPFGRYVRGATFVAYWATTNMNGISFWGRPDKDDLRTVTRALDAVLLPGRPHHRVLIDASQLSGVDVEAFSTIAAYMQRHRPVHAALCTRQALVRPNGLAGAVVAGFYDLIDPGYPVKTFDRAHAAMAWLEIPEGGRILQELERIHAEADDDVQRFLSRVRAYLEEDLGHATLSLVAEALRVSQRTLQRRLLDAGTSFRGELTAAQLRLARDLLAHSGWDLKRVAARLGYTSPARFSAFFRLHTGQSPSAWRAQQEQEGSAGAPAPLDRPR